MNDLDLEFDANSIEATIEVTAFKKEPDDLTDEEKKYWIRRRPKRTMSFKFAEVFENDEELDRALDTFVRSIKEMVRS